MLLVQQWGIKPVIAHIQVWGDSSSCSEGIDCRCRLMCLNRLLGLYMSKGNTMYPRRDFVCGIVVLWLSVPSSYSEARLTHYSGCWLYCSVLLSPWTHEWVTWPWPAGCGLGASCVKNTGMTVLQGLYVLLSVPENSCIVPSYWKPLKEKSAVKNRINIQFWNNAKDDSMSKRERCSYAYWLWMWHQCGDRNSQHPSSYKVSLVPL